MSVVDLPIRFGCSIPKMGVLLEGGLDDAGDGMAESRKLGKHLQNAMFDLLQYVRHTVRPVNLHQARILVDGSLIPVDVERLARERQFTDHPRLSLGPYVV